MNATERQSRLKLVSLLVLFALPVLLAVSSYYWSWPFSPTAGASHGELLLPTKPLPQFSGILNEGASEGETFTTDTMLGSWWLVVLGDGRCDLHCAADLFKVRQARLAIGRERTRVKTLYVSDVRAADASLKKVLLRHPETHILMGNSTLAHFMSRHGIYVVDPNGNLVLRYDDTATTKEIKSDLHRLLKVSRIG